MSGEHKKILLAKRPEGDIIPDEHFKTVTETTPKESDLEDGQVILEVLYLSLDPAMRTWLQDTRSYIEPVQVNDVMRGGCIGKVVASKSSQFKQGDLAVGSPGWKEYAVVSEKDLQKVDLPSSARITDALGILGMPGLTAYFGLEKIGQPKTGDLVVVSGAAGATGSVVCQLAKLKGARVVGIAGGKDKVQWLKELGCDVALDYKDSTFKDKFHEATKDHIDVYWDNVGGEILDLALGQAKEFARFVMCGQISQYNATEPTKLWNMLKVTTLRIRMQGFVIIDYASEWQPAVRELATWLQDGKIQRKEHVIEGGLEAAPQGLRDLFKGINTGKLVVEVKKP